MRLVFIVPFMALTVLAMAAPPESPTFNRDVLPILQRNCQTCHRPGEIGPMSLLTYADARPWARAIKEQVVTRSMPPWFADSDHGRFANDRRLSERDIRTIVDWVDAGVPEGDPGFETETSYDGHSVSSSYLPPRH